MATARERGRCRERLEQLSASSLDCDAIRLEAIAELRRVVGFDRWCWPLADPETVLPCSGLAEHDYIAGVPRTLDLEYSTDGYAAKPVLARRENAAGSLAVETNGDLARSPRWDQVMRHVGIGDVAAVACRDGLGCWGWIEAYRDRADRPFDEDDLALLEDAGPEPRRRAASRRVRRRGRAPARRAAAGRDRARRRAAARQLDAGRARMDRRVPRGRDPRALRDAAERDLPRGRDRALARGCIRRSCAAAHGRRALGRGRGGAARGRRHGARGRHAARRDRGGDVRAAVPRLRALAARAGGRRGARRRARHAGDHRAAVHLPAHRPGPPQVRLPQGRRLSRRELLARLRGEDA